MGSILTGYVHISYLLSIIGIIVLYESYMLLEGLRIKQEDISRKEIVENTRSEGSKNTDRIPIYSKGSR
jgi:hypothetical protein